MNKKTDETSPPIPHKDLFLICSFLLFPPNHLQAVSRGCHLGDAAKCIYSQFIQGTGLRPC